jgi:ankyrin repeat protein
VKTLPRPAYDGDNEALIRLCGHGGSGDVDEARDLIARGIDIDAVGYTLPRHSLTALMCAVGFNNLEMVQELIRAGATLDLQDEDGETALHGAATNDHIEILQELIRAGATLDLQDEGGKTALMYAAKYKSVEMRFNHLEIVQELICAGATLDVQDKKGRTALQLARKWGSTEIATLLEGAEAGVATMGSANEEADECAAGEGSAGGEAGEGKDEDHPPPPTPSAAQPVKTLPRPTYDGDKEALIRLSGFGGSGDVDEARDLIARGINIDEQNGYRKTALMMAVRYNRVEIAQELIRAGAALDLQDNECETALMDAAGSNRLEMVQELIRAGAALDVQDKRGMTVLQKARSSDSFMNPEIVALLEEAYM